MPLLPRMAPQCEPSGPLHGGSRGQHHFQQQQTQRPPPWSAPKIRPRRRSRNHRASRVSELRRGSRTKNLAGLLLAIAALTAVVSIPVVTLSRHRQRDLSGGDRKSRVELDLEIGDGDEEARLRREVQWLEDTLQDKKASLGIAPGLPLEERSAGDGRDRPETLGRVDASGQHNVEPVDLAGMNQNGEDPPQQRPAASRDQQQKNEQQHYLNGNSSPAMPKSALTGDPMFGGEVSPSRPSLESQPSLIREPVPLIVGGSDGSGTRGVVALLERLNVPMIVEDKGTMDVHGAPYMVKGGWPAVVRPVIQWAKGTGYEPRVAPASLRRTTFDALENLRVEMEKVSWTSADWGWIRVGWRVHGAAAGLSIARLDGGCSRIVSWYRSNIIGFR